MMRFVVLFTGYSLIIAACCNDCTYNYKYLSDWYDDKKLLSFNFTIDPTVSVGSVMQFWTNTGLRYGAHFVMIPSRYAELSLVGF